MELKRRYGPDGNVSHVEVIHTGAREGQNWSARCVEAWVEEGWMRVDGDTIVLTTAPDQPDLVYTIVRKPGYYSVETGERIPVSDIALTQFMTKTQATIAPREAQAWLASRGLTGGYVATRNYECTLQPDLHAQFKFKKGA